MHTYLWIIKHVTLFSIQKHENLSTIAHITNKNGRGLKQNIYQSPFHLHIMSTYYSLLQDTYVIQCINTIIT